MIHKKNYFCIAAAYNTTCKIVCILMFTSIIHVHSAWADLAPPQFEIDRTLCQTYELESETKPASTTPLSSSTPTAARPIQRPKKITMLGCPRPFLHKGIKYSVDSPEAQDAMTLRTFLLDTPEALKLVDEYKKNRTLSEISAYTGTIGIITFALAGLVSSRFDSPTRESLKTAMTIGGLALATGGFVYSFTLLKANDGLLQKAVNQYNLKHPQEPITLQFEAGFTF